MRRHVAVVTGATRGLGLETARRLAARGRRVVLAARREPEGSAAAAALAAHGADVRCWPLDVADPTGAAAFAARARAEALRIDALVHNAGLYPDQVDAASARDGELAPRGVLVNAVCPGWVRTAMGGAGAPRSVEEGAEGIVWAATLAPDGPSGGFFRDGRPVPW